MMESTQSHALTQGPPNPKSKFVQAYWLVVGISTEWASYAIARYLYPSANMLGIYSQQISLFSRTSSHSPPSHSISWFALRSQSQLMGHEFTRFGVWDVQRMSRCLIEEVLSKTFLCCQKLWDELTREAWSLCHWICLCWSAWTPAHCTLTRVLVGRSYLWS